MSALFENVDTTDQHEIILFAAQPSVKKRDTCGAVQDPGCIVEALQPLGLKRVEIGALRL